MDNFYIIIDKMPIEGLFYWDKKYEKRSKK